MKNNEVEVKVSASTQDVTQGMDGAANAVTQSLKRMSEEINRIVSQLSKVGVSTKEVSGDMKEMAATANTKISDPTPEMRSGVEKTQTAVNGLMTELMGLVSLGAIIGFVRQSKEAITEAESAFRGLEAVANYTGVGIGRAMQEAEKLASDGLMTTADAAKALQNLLSRGYNIDQAVETLNRLKDAAAYNKAAHLSMADAVVSATEGLKNENSILVDNAGVTKNVAKMWEEWAAAHGKSTNDMTQAEKILAEYNGIMVETEAQVGNAAKAANGLQGQQAKLNAEWLRAKQIMGEALTPAFIKLAEWGGWLAANIFPRLLAVVKSIAIEIGMFAQIIGDVFDAVTNFNFDGLTGKIKAAAKLRDEMIDEAWSDAKAQSLGEGPQFDALPDNGKRKKTDTGAPIDQKKLAKEKAKALEDAYAAEMAALKREEDTYRNNLAMKIEIARQEAYVMASQHGANSKEHFEALQHVEALERQHAAQMAKIADIARQESYAAEMAALNERQKAAEFDAEIGEISQRQLIEQKHQFLAERQQLELDDINQRIELKKADPDSDPVALAELEARKNEIMRQYAAERTELTRASVRDQMKIWDDLSNRISSLWDKGVQAMMNGTLKWKNAQKAILMELAGFGAKIVGDMVKTWIAGEIKKLAATKTISLKQVMINAWQSFTEAFKAMVGIPVVGPAIAPAAGASAFASVASAAGSIASARGGYDIPAGINPVTQLHEQEMVLPKEQADAIRNLAAGGSGGSTIMINTKGGDFIHKNDLATLLKQMKRDFKFVS